MEKFIYKFLYSHH